MNSPVLSRRAMSEPRDSNGEGGRSQRSDATSPSLLQRVRANDAAAWDRLVLLYAPLVWHWCRSWSLQPADSADVSQEVFQAVAAHVSGFHKQETGGTFRGWLRTITHNKVHDLFRRRGREPGGVGGTDAQQRMAEFHAPRPPEESSAADRRADHDLCHRALSLIRGEFEERTWQAFWRTAIEGRAAKDVADELAMSPGAVRVAKSRVLHRLREELGELIE